VGPLKFQPLVWTIMLLALAMSGRLQVPTMALAMTVLGFAGAMGNVELDTNLIVKVPDEKLARVSSIEMLLDFLAGVLGPAAGGCLTEWWGTERAIWILLGVSGFVALAGLVLWNPVIASEGVIPETTVASGRTPELTEAAPARPQPGSRDRRMAERQPVTAVLRSGKRPRAGVS
jgi:MFS family permease